MDKTFNFFKNKHVATSNQSQHQQQHNSYTPKHNQKYNIQIQNQNPISKKQKEIRQAIEYRYQRSKLRVYSFQRQKKSEQKTKSKESAQMQQYKNLRKMRIVDLKQYHKRQQSMSSSSNSSQERSKFNLRLKLKDNNSTIIKTEGHYSSQKSPYINQLLKSMTPTKPKINDKWKFISIQIKEDASKSKHKKQDLKISSHRSYILPSNKSIKAKTNSSTGKYMDKVPRLKDLSKLNKTKF